MQINASLGHSAYWRQSILKLSRSSYEIFQIAYVILRIIETTTLKINSFHLYQNNHTLIQRDEFEGGTASDDITKKDCCPSHYSCVRASLSLCIGFLASGLVGD